MIANKVLFLVVLVATGSVSTHAIADGKLTPEQRDAKVEETKDSISELKSDLKDKKALVSELKRARDKAQNNKRDKERALNVVKASIGYAKIARKSLSTEEQAQLDKVQAEYDNSVAELAAAKKELADASAEELKARSAINGHEKSLDSLETAETCDDDCQAKEKKAKQEEEDRRWNSNSAG